MYRIFFAYLIDTSVGCSIHCYSDSDLCNCKTFDLMLSLIDVNRHL